MNIAYSCDERYIQHTGISMISLFENNKDAQEINIYFIAKNVSEKSINQLQNIVNDYNRKLIVIPFAKLCSKLNNVHIGRHIETIYAKVFFGNIQNVDKIFYLDSDTIICDSLLPLWEKNMDGFYFGCVKTITKDPCKALGISERDDFFNDGVALINTKALREGKMEDKFLRYIADYDGNPPFLSEGTINVVCKGKILPIEPKYNLLSGFLMFKNDDLRKVARQQSDFYSDKELNSAKNSPVVIHYLTGWYKRPWEEGCSHPLREYYHKYKAKSPWSEQPLIYRSIPFKIRLLKVVFNNLPIRFVLFIRRVFVMFTA